MAKVKFKRNTKSSREIRRIAEREQGRERRQQYIEEFWKLPPDIRAQRMESPLKICTWQRKKPTVKA